jgi:hypothetical protein
MATRLLDETRWGKKTVTVGLLQKPETAANVILSVAKNLLFFGQFVDPSLHSG